MAWVVQLEEVVDGTVVSRTEVATLDRPRCLESLEDLGLRLADAKPMLASIQREIVTQQIKQDAARQSSCPDCGEGRQVKDYRVRRFDTLFGRIEVRVPRFVCPTYSEPQSSDVGTAIIADFSTTLSDSIRGVETTLAATETRLSATRPQSSG